MKEDEFTRLFGQGKNDLFKGRYLVYTAVENYLQSLPSDFNLKREGESVLGRPLYSLTTGQGETKILLWSQMHGNETTTTKAVLDFLRLINLRERFTEELLQTCQIKIIPVLNPDGAVAYTRLNAHAVDLNRDAVEQTQPEIRLLQQIAADFQPDFCFNMHDQRSIYSVGNNKKPATLSFLSPAYDVSRNTNASRQTAMQIIAGIDETLQKFIPGQTGRYDDKFNPNCIGDYFQSKHIPTLLFEAGHHPEDYFREKTRKFVFIALCRALELISRKLWKNYSQAAYEAIPENKKLFYDIIVRNVLHKDELTDMAFQYEERLIQNAIKFIPKLTKIGKLHDFYGHTEIDANQQIASTFPKQNINIGLETENIVINDKIIPLTLTNN